MWYINGRLITEEFTQDAIVRLGVPIMISHLCFGMISALTFQYLQLTLDELRKSLELLEFNLTVS